LPTPPLSAPTTMTAGFVMKLPVPFPVGGIVLDQTDRLLPENRD
jgi:hypothetical protein